MANEGVRHLRGSVAVHSAPKVALLVDLGGKGCQNNGHCNVKFFQVMRKATLLPTRHLFSGR